MGTSTARVDQAGRGRTGSVRAALRPAAWVRTSVCAPGAWVIRALPTMARLEDGRLEGASLSSRSCVAIDQLPQIGPEAPLSASGPGEWCLGQLAASGRRWCQRRLNFEPPAAAGCRSFRRHRPDSAAAPSGREVSDRGSTTRRTSQAQSGCSVSRAESACNASW